MLYRSAQAALIASVLGACGSEPEHLVPADLGAVEVDLPLPACSADPPAFRVDTLATGLEVPWDVAFLPDGRALVTERPGRIRTITPDQGLLEEPWAEIDVYSDAESGLLGIDATVAPDGTVDVYVAASVARVGGSGLARLVRAAFRRMVRTLDPERGHTFHRQVLRLSDEAGRGVRPTVLVDEIPSSPIHAGGALRIGPDGLLYTTNGDASAPWFAQAERSLRGKVLRYRLDGGVPDGNPFGPSPVFALGTRNIQGLEWHPDSGELFAIEHGPSGLEREGFRTDDDELNVVTPGANLGWPVVTGATEGGAVTSPLAVWRTAVAPGSLALVADSVPRWGGSAFVTGLRSANLRRLALERDAIAGWRVTCEDIYLDATYGRLRMLRMAPDGSIWLGTSNRDQRGFPRDGSDLILRLTARASE